MDALLDGLNPAQREAVTATEGYVRVIAGAGSGKTRALSRRFAYLVEELGILPGNILCVTFTNKSANEMRQRIHHLTGDSDTGYINTFHGFCVSVLQEDCHALQYPRSFLVLDNSDIDAMLQQIYDERGLTLRDMTFSKARDYFEIRKLSEEPEYYRDLIRMDLETLHQKYLEAADPKDILFYGYLYQEKKCFALDYNDLIKFVLYLFAENPEIRMKWQRRLEYIMIDEFQDIDGLQYQLMEVLCGYHRNLFVVGDPDQTIYTWRGADVRYLLHFDRDFTPVRTIVMTENYRSTPEILAAANSLIARNRHRYEKNLRAVRPSGCPVICRHADSAADEAAWMAEEICRLHDAGTDYRDMAVLYRAHYVTRSVEETFLQKQLPYSIYSGVQFFARAEIKDALSYLRMIAYRDDLSFRRIANTPRRNLGKRRMAILQEMAAAQRCTLYEALTEALDTDFVKGTRARQFVELVEHFSASAQGRPVSEVLSALLDASGYEKMLRTEGSQERLDNLAELKQSIYEYETTCGEEADLEHYLSHVALFTNGDAAEPGDRVRLMTVHAAKGLEFPVVFLCGMNEGIFPSRKVRTLASMEEERRLAFVAVTRAEDRLYLSEAGGSGFDGAPRYPSRFLLDVDERLLVHQPPLRDGLIREARRYIDGVSRRLGSGEPSELLQSGTRVRHSVFGPGTVLEADPDRGAYRVQFDDLETPRQISARARLERL